MDGSSNLIIAPNFNGVPNLKELVLARCSNLRKLHPSVGKLKKLKLLDLDGCPKLTSLPDKFEMESLVTLNLSDCLNVKKIPELAENMRHLRELVLRGTAITELPSSVECLTGLHTLMLGDCKNLVCLPNTICSLTSLSYIGLRSCSKFDKLPEDLGNITSLKWLVLTETAIKELPSSVEFLNELISLSLQDCKNFVRLPGTICSLKRLTTIPLCGCSKFDKLPEDLGNITHLVDLNLGETAIKELPSSVEFLIYLTKLYLNDCKNLVYLPSTICNLKRLNHLDLTGCSKFANLPENLGSTTMSTSLRMLLLGGTAIKELPSSTIRIKWLERVSFKGCQLSSSSLTSMPRCCRIDLSDCNLSAIPIGIDRISMTRCFNLFLRGNDFVSLPESISQFSELRSIFLDGCKSLRSLSNIQIPSTVCLLPVNNCTSLERLPELPCRGYDLTVQCFNCFKLASSIQNLSNMFQVSLSLISVCFLNITYLRNYANIL